VTVTIANPDSLTLLGAGTEATQGSMRQALRSEAELMLQ